MDRLKDILERKKNVFWTEDDPVVSVIVVTYNHEKYIRDCLEGILMQETDFDFEICIGEDESSDDTRQICREYAGKHRDIIRLFERSRDDVIYVSGRPTGRFNGLMTMAEAKGKYCIVCEGDDYWTAPSKLQRQVDLLESKPECSAVFHNARIFDQDQYRFLEGSYPSHLPAIIDRKSLINQNYIPTASIMFRNFYRGVDLLSLFGGMVFADRMMHLISASIGKISYIDETWSVYRIHSGGVYHHYRKNDDPDGIMDQIKHLEQVEKLFQLSPDEKNILNKAFRREKSKLFVCYITRNELSNAKPFLKAWSKELKQTPYNSLRILYYKLKLSLIG